MSTKYVVDIDLQVHGDLPGAVDKAGKGIEKVDKQAAGLGSTLSGLGSRLVSGFTGAVESVGSTLMSLGKIGIASAIAGATYGVTGLNNELETTRVSLAAVLTQNGLTASIEGGMERAAGWVAQMRKDARDLPGEFKDLLGIVQSGAGAAFQAGLDDVSFEKLAANAMAAGKALSVDSAQAGRDLARLLGGSAGMDNMLGSRLGFTAENFNKLSKPEQVQKITAALDKFQPAIKAFGGTFDAISSSLLDNVKSFGISATSGLFERVKSAMMEANAWFDANQDKVKLWGDRISQFLADAFDDGKKIVEDWGPSIISFAERFYDKFMAAWREAEPLVKSIAASVKGFLDDPKSLDTLTTVLKLYATAKVGSGALGMANDLGLGSLGGTTLRAVGGSGAMAALKGAASSGLSAAGGVAGELGAGLAAGGVGVAGLLVGIQAAITGAIAAAAYEIYHANTLGYDSKGGGAYGYSEGAKSYVDDQVARAIGLARGAEGQRWGTINNWRAEHEMSMPDIGMTGSTLAEYTDALRAARAEQANAEDHMRAFADATFETSESMLELQTIISGLAKSGDFENIDKINDSLLAAQQEAAFAADETARVTDQFKLNGAAMGIAAIKALDAADARAKERQKKAAEGSNVVNIARVEITISNNNAPGQVARDVAQHLTEMRRYRRSSPGALNVSAGR